MDRLDEWLKDPFQQQVAEPEHYAKAILSALRLSEPH